jgi:hypothetical protein
MTTEGPGARQPSPGLPITPKDYTDLLVKMWIENMAQARHQETLRSSLTAVVLALSTALLGFVGLMISRAPDRAPILAAMVAATLIFLLGQFGKRYMRNIWIRYEYWYQGAVAQIKACNSILEQHGYGNPGQIFDSLATKGGKANKPPAPSWTEVMNFVSAIGGAAALLCAGLLIATWKGTN